MRLAAPAFGIRRLPVSQELARQPRIEHSISFISKECGDFSTARQGQTAFFAFFLLTRKLITAIYHFTVLL
jgi:hypothetical protein